MNKLVRRPFCHMSRENIFSNEFKLIVSAIYEESFLSVLTTHLRVENEACWHKSLIVSLPKIAYNLHHLLRSEYGSRMTPTLATHAVEANPVRSMDNTTGISDVCAAISALNTKRS
jgi:hypothetical protein